MKKKSDIVGQVRAKLREYLADVPFASVQAQERPLGREAPGLDLFMRFRAGGEERLLVIEVKRNGQPRLLREGVNQVLRYQANMPGAYCIVAAPYISESAGKIASEAGAGYLDLAGNCRLAFDNVYIRRAGWANPAVERRELRSLYSPKAERVLRVLLADPRRTWKMEPLAEESQVSLGMAFKVKQLLDDREWLRREPDGFRLGAPAELLSDWAASYRYGRNRVREYFSLDPVPQIEAKLPDVCQRICNYALTGFSAAARMAPMVRYQKAAVYVLGPIDQVAQGLGLKRVDTGANVNLIDPYDEGVLFGASEVDGIRVASALQTYLDLLNVRGRGEEAAEAVLEQVIKPSW